MLTLGEINSFLDCNPLHPHPIGMQLYLEGGAWFKEKSSLEKISFLVDWPLSERAIKCQQASWPEDDVKPIKPFLYIYVKHLILTRVRSADPRMTLDSSLHVTKGI